MTSISQPATIAPVIPLRRPEGRPRPHAVRGTRPESTRPETLDERKTEVLYQRHRPSVLRFVRTLTLGDEHLAEDIIQETFLRAWRTPDLIVDGPDGCHNWLTKVARNLVIDRLRWRGCRPPETGDQQLPMVAAPGSEMDRVDTSLTVRDALARLTPDRRAILVEVYLRGRSVTEVAESLGIPLGTAKSRIHYALRALRQVLEEPAGAVEQRYAA
jgi:RNA polymerase sigma-70 factor (ECF subfamily)